MDKKEFEAKLIVGAKVKIGRKYAKEIGGLKAGEVIELVQGYFDHDNGLYTETKTAPAIWNEECKEFDSIYHLFGNNFEDFMDCKILTNEQ
jgi:hypothetical protein